MINIENVQQTGRNIELRKLVIKLGSAVVAGPGNNMDETTLAALADSIASLREQGVQVILVSSGAIGMGRAQFPAFRPKTIPDRQALAAIGQVGLMHMYKNLFNERGFKAAQVLLTREDLADRRRYLNARYTLERLLELGAVPVINENDTVTIDELKFGDNDELSALVATKMNADLLIILSVIDGLYSADPTAAKGHGKAPRKFGSIIRVVDEWSAEVLGAAGKSKSSLGTGGMASKLTSVQMATKAGVHAVIAGGKTPGIIEKILSGQFTGTYFVPCNNRKFSGRAGWIAFGRPAGGRQVVVDAGARDALVERKKSLLAAGVKEIHGDFARGELVEVIGPDGERIAKGVVNYAAEELRLIKGKKSSEIKELLGEVDYQEVIHRDNMAML